MKTFLKVLLIVAILALVVHCWPVAVIPIVLGVVVAFAVGGAAAGVVALAVGLVSVVALAFVGVAIGLITALSPIWIPLALIAGIVWIVRALSRQHA